MPSIFGWLFGINQQKQWLKQHRELDQIMANFLENIETNEFHNCISYSSQKKSHPIIILGDMSKIKNMKKIVDKKFLDIFDHNFFSAQLICES